MRRSESSSLVRKRRFSGLRSERARRGAARGGMVVAGGGVGDVG